MDSEHNYRQWGFAWLGLVAALALHVTDEALTGFLPLYNSIVQQMRATVGFVPFPTFTFPVWLTGLVLAILVLLMLAPLVFAGRMWLRYVSVFLSVLMILNAVGHLGASLYWHEIAPGAYSSPILLLAAIVLVVATPFRSLGRAGRRRTTG